MNITEKGMTNCEVVNLAPGSVFKIDSHFYIRGGVDACNQLVECTCLSSGAVVKFRYHTQAIPCEAILTVERL